MSFFALSETAPTLARGKSRCAQRTLRAGLLRVGQLAVACCWLVQMACASSGSRATVSSRIGADSAAMAALAREQTGDALSSAIGIPPFQVLAQDAALSSLGFAVADLLTTDLSRSANVLLVERSRLHDVVRELDLARAGRLDSASAPRVGRLLRAERLVLGSVDTMGTGELRLSVRVADVASGSLEAAIDARASLVDVLAAEKTLAFRLLEVLGVRLSPAERARIAEYPTTSLAALNAYGRGVEANMFGDPRRAVDEFEKAARMDPNFLQARERAQSIRTDARRTATAPSVLPGMQAISAPMSGTIDRLNRPLDIITSLSRPLSGPGDPSFPSTLVTVVITVTRP